eukprot:354436_1
MADEDDYKRETIKIYNPTYLLRPRPGTKFLRSSVEKIASEVLEEGLRDVKYDAEDAASISKELSRTIQNRVKELGYERYKLVTQVTITQASGQGLRVSSRCLWDPEVDNYAEAVYKNETLIAVALVFGCYWE